MSGPKGQSANGDAMRQHEIDEMNREAHERYDVSRSWAAHARLEGKIGDTWEDFGELAAAEGARHDEANDLAIANNEDERVYELLVLTRILRDAQSNAGVTKLNAAAPQLRTSLATMSAAIHNAVSDNSDARQQLDRLYRRLAEQLNQPVGDREGAVALLENLELYLKGVQRLAHTNGSVREVWLQQADVLTAVL